MYAVLRFVTSNDDTDNSLTEAIYEKQQEIETKLPANCYDIDVVKISILENKRDGRFIEAVVVYKFR